MPYAQCIYSNYFSILYLIGNLLQNLCTLYLNMLYMLLLYVDMVMSVLSVVYSVTYTESKEIAVAQFLLCVHKRG